MFEILEGMEGRKIYYSRLMYWSGDNNYFKFAEFGSSSCFYLRLMNCNIGINLAKLNMKEFKDQIDRLVRKKTKKKQHKNNIKKMF